MAKKTPIIAVQASGLTCADAASLLDCSKAHISYLISTGQIKAERVGGRFLLVDPDSVAEYAQNPNRRDRASTKDTRKKRPSLKELADKAMAVAKEAHASTVEEIKKSKKPRIKVRALTQDGWSDEQPTKKKAKKKTSPAKRRVKALTKPKTARRKKAKV